MLFPSRNPCFLHLKSDRAYKSDSQVSIMARRLFSEAANCGLLKWMRRRIGAINSKRFLATYLGRRLRCENFSWPALDCARTKLFLVIASGGRLSCVFGYLFAESGLSEPAVGASSRYNDSMATAHIRAIHRALNNELEICVLGILQYVHNLTVVLFELAKFLY
jgi:hypothetical protein